MTRSCASQFGTVSRLWVGPAYDGGSEDLRVELVSKMPYKCSCSI